MMTFPFNNLKCRKTLGFHGGDYKEYRLLVFGAVRVLFEPTFQRDVSPPSSGQKESATLFLAR
jgi:hypothetical protein